MRAITRTICVRAKGGVRPARPMIYVRAWDDVRQRTEWFTRGPGMSFFFRARMRLHLSLGTLF